MMRLGVAGVGKASVRSQAVAAANATAGHPNHDLL